MTGKTRATPRSATSGEEPEPSGENNPRPSGAEAKPGRPRSAEAEKAILEAALALLTKHGVDGTTIEQIAAKAGVAKTTVYRRWPDKRALIIDAIAHLRGPVPMPEGKDFRSDLLFVVQAARKGTNDQIGLLMHRMWATAGDDTSLFEACRNRMATPRRKVLHDVLRRGMAEGAIRSDIDVMIVGEMLIGPIFSAHFSRSHRYTDAEVEALVDTVLRGLAP